MSEIPIFHNVQDDSDWEASGELSDDDYDVINLKNMLAHPVHTKIPNNEGFTVSGRYWCARRKRII
jgi:hypothetical protein